MDFTAGLMPLERLSQMLDRIPLHAGPVDGASLTKGRFRVILAGSADVVISSGGVSVGEADYTKTLLEELGKSPSGSWRLSAAGPSSWDPAAGEAFRQQCQPAAGTCARAGGNAPQKTGPRFFSLPGAQCCAVWGRKSPCARCWMRALFAQIARHDLPAAGKIVMYDAMTCQFREMKLMRNPGGGGSNFTIAASTAGEVINCCATSSGSVMAPLPAGPLWSNWPRAAAVPSVGIPSAFSILIAASPSAARAFPPGIDYRAQLTLPSAVFAIPERTAGPCRPARRAPMLGLGPPASGKIRASFLTAATSDVSR
ncbi:hypothetical protein T636_A1531 [Enterobacter hormaechei subsp. xiangfangensis]|nr:hypothetical protein T636_A1531 [Enterobacter hormaechei subsp. xiangfangensis]